MDDLQPMPHPVDTQSSRSYSLRGLFSVLTWESIAVRLNVVFVILVTTLLVLSGAYTYWNSSRALQSQYHEARISFQERVQASLPQAVWYLDRQLIMRNLAAELKGPVRGIAVRDPDGFLLASIGLQTVPNGSKMRSLTFPISYMEDGSKHVLGNVTALWSDDELEQALRTQVLQRVIEIVILDILLVAVLSLSLNILVLRPLDMLKRALQKAADSKESVMLKLERRDEFGAVVQGFNRIAQRLSNDLQRREQAEDEARAAYKDLQAAQASLVEAEKLAALGGLVAGVAHEINTPLGITLTGATLLDEEIQRFQEGMAAGMMKRADVASYLDTARDTIKLITSNLDRAAHLVQNFKQIAVDQTSEARRDFDLAIYLTEIIDSLRPQYKRTAIEVRSICPPDIHVDGYPGALAQVVTNFVVNAVIHAFDEGQVGSITINGSCSNETVYLEVIDNGKGIPPENLPHIFEPFFTTRRGAGGSGLGLNIVYNLITQRLGGQIEARSTLGEGTCFRLTFPSVAP